MKKLIPIILIIISIAAFFAVIDPQYDQVKILKLKKEKNSGYLEKALLLEERRDELKRQYDSIPESDRKQLEKLLPDTVDNVRLILDINNIAETYGIQIKDIEISSKSNETNSDNVINNQTVVDQSEIQNADLVGTIVLGFSIAADYEIFKQFISDLENKLRIVDVRQIDISTSETSTAYEYKISLDTYWLR